MSRLVDGKKGVGFSFSNGTKGLEALLGSRQGWVIDELNIVRRPLPKILATASNFLNTKKHDEIFHLYQQILLRNPATGEQELINFEKHETINTTRNAQRVVEPENRVKVDLGGKQITIEEYIKNGQAASTRAGKHYFNYSLTHNNCQDFTLLHLRGNGLGNALNNQAAVDFISQNAQSLIPKWATKITDFVTNGLRVIGEVIGVSK